MADSEALPHRSYPVGYADGHWTIRVAGGPAFLANATLALKFAALECEPGPRREALERLMRACAEVADVG